MPMPEICRCLPYEVGPGDWNMAVDAALLESVSQSGSAVLRFYGWQQATLSLGYFQGWQQRQQHPPSLACPMVRRDSGGGAIVHDRELTYSLCAPRDWLGRADAGDFYRLFHESLAEVLSQLTGATYHLSEEETAADEAAPFLCFQRRAVGDLLCGREKVTGSAQRRPRQTLLQHGSVLLARSAAAPELPGLAELSGRSLQPAELAQSWQTDLAARLGVFFQSGELSAEERVRAEALIEQKYGHPDWTQRR